MDKEEQRRQRIGEMKYNNQGCLMKIIQYNTSKDIIVEFHDKYGAKIHTEYINFKKGNVRNPYYPKICGVGISGNQKPIIQNGKNAKEYEAWVNIIKRCYNKKVKNKYPAYNNATCCDEWLLYENFYEWLHGQPNFDKWLCGHQWSVDKDILIKGNKLYSPNTCCLVPSNVNAIFIKCDSCRGDLPIGVIEGKNSFKARCNNQLLNKIVYLGSYSTTKQAFKAYKTYKEKHIKEVAKIEYDKGNITKRCYDAMMNYEVEITD